MKRANTSRFLELLHLTVAKKTSAGERYSLGAAKAYIASKLGKSVPWVESLLRNGAAVNERDQESIIKAFRELGHNTSKKELFYEQVETG